MKSFNTSIAILAASMVIVMLGFGIAIPLMPFFVTHFNASGSAMGLMMSLFSFMQFLFAPFWGRISDRIGRKPVLIIGMLGYAISFFLQGISQNMFQFTLARTLGGILSSAALPTAMAFVADVTSDENRSKGVGTLGASMGMGMIFGPMLGGLLTHVSIPFPPVINALLQVTTDATTGELIQLSIPFFVSGLLALINLPFIYFLLPESLPKEKRNHPVAQKRATQLTSLFDGLRGPAGFLFLMAFLIAFALANMESVLALYGKQHFNMSPSDIGILMGAMGLLSVIQQGILFGPLTRRFGENRLIQGGLAIAILGMLGLALASNKVLLIAGAIVFNTGNVILQPSVTSILSRRATQQGEAMGINNSFQSLGRAVGPLWAGFAYDLSNTLSFWSGALIQLVALIYAINIFSKENPPARTEARSDSPS